LKHIFATVAKICFFFIARICLTKKEDVPKWIILFCLVEFGSGPYFLPMVNRVSGGNGLAGSLFE